jgi:uncharacterized protein YcaQ
MDDTQRASASGSVCITPGFTDRLYPAGLTSTAKRPVGLARFGGPARRVIPQTQNDEDNESQEQSPVLVCMSIIAHGY